MAKCVAMSRLLTAGAAAVGATVLAVSPALASTEDGFTAWTTNDCGYVQFVDYGPGAPGGGDNDDYFLVHDACADGHGVWAGVTVNGGTLHSTYWGGSAGTETVWDPVGSLGPGDFITVEVCLVDGPNDSTKMNCGGKNHTMADG